MTKLTKVTKGGARKRLVVPIHVVDDLQRVIDMQDPEPVVVALKKLELLFEQFGLPRRGDPAQDYKLLAFALAVTFVPGFQLEQRRSTQPGFLRGRKRKITPTYLACVLYDYEQLGPKTVATTHKLGGGTLDNWLRWARDPDLNPFLGWYEASKKAGPEGLKAFKADLDVLRQTDIDARWAARRHEIKAT